MADFGELLRQAREQKGVSLREADRATRISRVYLEALEHHDFEKLPASTYARGIIRNYANFLGLDPKDMLSRYEDLTGTRSGPFEVVPATKPIDLSTHWAPNFAIIAFMIVMSLVVFTWMYSAYFQKGDSIATGTVGVATVTPMADSLLAAVGTQPTIATQGGGVATVTLTITPSPLPSPTATVAPQPTATTPPVEVPAAPTEAEPADDLTDEPATAGAHAFVVWVLEEVWVHVTIDGEPVYNDVLPAGGELVYEGETLEVTSGNAAHVVVYVDGEEYALGNSWDATFVYP